MLAIARGPYTEPHVVDDLIARARKHPLGIDFLLHGYLGTVAISFDAHAFTVEAARARLLAGNVARSRVAVS
ncbi:MAG TPA: hypothetical protein VHU41_17135 [Thermoanaerobaculia bacterium]|jgi:hypothetical protein|nr:hypothetical protein [Thermoanaerobaculia bacterium]